MSILRDDKDRLVISAGEGTLMVAPVAGDMKVRVGDLVGAAVAHIDRDDAVALRDWINAALTSGAIR